MSNNSETRNVSYDPLPLTNDDYSSELYNAPPSPEPRLSMFHTPQMDPTELGLEENPIPPGATPPRFLGTFYSSPSMRDSFASSTHTIPGANSQYNSSLHLNDPPGTTYRDDPQDTMHVSSATGRSSEEKRAAYAPRAKSTRKIMILAVIVALALIIAAVVIPLYFFVIKPKPSGHNNIGKATASSNAAIPSISSGAGPGGNSNVRVTGGNGSIVTTENGTTFVYQNPFGGYWYWDENDPFNESARAQSWSPPLNGTFNYGVDQVRGLVLRL